METLIYVDKIHYKNNVNHKIQPWITDGLIISYKKNNKLHWDMLHGKCSQNIYKNYNNKPIRLLRTTKKTTLLIFYLNINQILKQFGILLINI